MENLVFFYSEGHKIFANIQIPRRGAPCILMSHGLESSKDGNKWRFLAPKFSEAGFATLRFSYRGCGEGNEKSEGRFEGTVLSARIKDYKTAIDYLGTTEGDVNRLGVIGSSFGGMTALAAKDRRVKAMIALSTPSRLRPPTEGEIEAFRRRGYFELESGKRLVSDIYADAQKHNINTREDVKEIGCPLLVIHSRQDEVVPVGSAYELHNNAKEPKRLEIIEGANHSFDAPEHVEQVAKLSLEWFKKYL